MHVGLQVWWEVPCWWEAWGPGPCPSPLKSGPVALEAGYKPPWPRPRMARGPERVLAAVVPELDGVVPASSQKNVILARMIDD